VGLRVPARGRVLTRAGALAALLALAALAAPAARAQDRVPVVIEGGKGKTYRIAVQRFRDGSTPPHGDRIARFRDALSQALEFSGVFQRVPDGAFLGPIESGSLEATSIVCPDWTQIGADALVEGELSRDGTGMRVAFRVWDTARCRDLMRRRYTQSATSDPEVVARRVADDVVEAFLGVRGVSSTEIAFVSDRTGSKEIYVMQADGGGVRRATANRSINNFPNWAPDGQALAYTSYRQGNRPLVFLSSRGARRPGRLLPSDGRSQYRAVFDPLGKSLAIVIANGAASEIYAVGDDGRGLRRLTNSSSIEVSPSWAPDGERLAFVSDRTGAPQIYVMNADGGGVRRLTYDGAYNTSPAWSPDGLWIAYETRIDGQFDIWLIDPEGKVNVPLVPHERSDEAPSWAPNSRHVVFSSTRRGRADLYMIDRDGSNLRRLTSDGGNNTAPAWGPFAR
jgi:TolB protein